MSAYRRVGGWVIALLAIVFIHFSESSEAAPKAKPTPPPNKAAIPATVPTPAPLPAPPIDKGGAERAIMATIRVTCAKTDSAGTGFLHKSGRVVTAAHVVHGCVAGDLQMVTVGNQVFKVTAVISDAVLDLALLTPAQNMGPGLSLRTDDLSIGDPVATWGFPMGYPGFARS